MNSSATGRGALAYGFGANASAENTMAMGGFASANGNNLSRHWRWCRR